ncbi:MAG: SRPBCC family protein [Acidobacteriota bacterium]|nr:SRPBCC family protein [Acidobacteriota bacterium]
MILKIVFVFGALIAAVLVFAATKAPKFRVQRSVMIDAPRQKIFPLINDFHNWSRWAPQDKEDVNMKRTYSGSASGEGAISQWHGAGSTGRGSMLITKSVPSNSVSIKVDFIKPFEAHNLDEFDLEPNGSSTKVTWTMQGTNLYIMKVMGVFVNMDRLMGRHFETGLHNLKIVAEQ